MQLAAREKKSDDELLQPALIRLVLWCRRGRY